MSSRSLVERRLEQQEQGRRQPVQELEKNRSVNFLNYRVRLRSMLS